jgi:7-cyano-7-deazaguanine reductase
LADRGMTDDKPASDNALQRRQLLRLENNPRQSLDFLVRLRFSPRTSLYGGAVSEGLSVRLRYVPDRQLLVPASLIDYGAALETQDFDGLEALGIAIFEDFNDQLVPRWINVAVGSAHYVVTLEDRQPNWSNDALLASRGD